MTEEQLLADMLMSSPWHRSALEAVSVSGAPDAWIAAGAIRDLVWDERFGGGFDPAAVKDIDVVFFDPDDLRAARDHEVEASLSRLEPELPWEAKNQAAVHRWYAQRFGTEVEPLISIEDAVGTFPETATAVAARLESPALRSLRPSVSATSSTAFGGATLDASRYKKLSRVWNGNDPALAGRRSLSSHPDAPHDWRMIGRSSTSN